MFECINCGYETKKWFGQCPKCKEYNTVEEVKEQLRDIKVKAADVIKLKDVDIIETARIETQNKQIDTLLGGGFVIGSLNLLVGSPGIGKSTVMLQIINNIQDQNLLYVSSEESLGQIKLRANRLKFNADVDFLNEDNLEVIFQTIHKNKITFVIIDSIQTTYSNATQAVKGSVNQLKLVTMKLMEFAKKEKITIVIIGHVTKEGDIAGPKLLEHMVDVVLLFEKEHDKIRTLKAVKNRFGSVDEIAYFQMKNNGLVDADLSENVFDGEQNQVGACLSAIEEGQKVIFTQVQALTTPTVFGAAKRSSQGIENSRVQLIIAILNKKTNVDLSYVDVYAKLFGGVKTGKTNTDLALAIAIYSSEKSIPLRSDEMFIGEVNLTGSIKTHGDIKKILMNAHKKGIKKVYLSSSQKFNAKSMEIINCENIEDVIHKLGR